MDKLSAVECLHSGPAHRYHWSRDLCRNYWRSSHPWYCWTWNWRCHSFFHRVSRTARIPVRCWKCRPRQRAIQPSPVFPGIFKITYQKIQVKSKIKKNCLGDGAWLLDFFILNFNHETSKSYVSGCIESRHESWNQKKVIQEFERKHKIEIENIDIDSFTGKRLRGELLVNFKELSGLIYAELIEFLIFSDLQLSSLGKLYRDAKKRLRTSGEE